jgi:hypothetical protein
MSKFLANKYPIFLIFAAFSIGIYLMPRLSYPEIGFPLDDAWIHQTFARNIAQGNGWTFNQGQPSAGLTAPLWGALLALGHFIFKSPYPAPIILGWVTLASIGVLTYRLLIHFFPNEKIASFIGGSIIIFEWHFVWAALSGMETLLFGLFVLFIFSQITLKEFSAIKWGNLGVWIGVAMWIRPEAILSMFPVVLFSILSSENLKESISHLISMALGLIIPVFLYLGFNYLLGGSAWPSTFYAKQAEYAILLDTLLISRIWNQLSLTLVGGGVIIFPAFLYAIIKSIKLKKWVILSFSLWYVGTAILYALRLPVVYQHGRYMIPAMTIYLYLSLHGLIWIFSDINKSKKKFAWMIKPIWGISTIVVTAGFYLLGIAYFQSDVRFINSEMVEMGMWIAKNTSEDTVIATHDIGAIGYFGNRQILDLAGLISPDIIPIIRDEDKIFKMLEIESPDYFVTFPSWYPELTPSEGELFDTGGTRTTEFGLDSMKIFEFPFEKNN